MKVLIYPSDYDSHAPEKSTPKCELEVANFDHDLGAMTFATPIPDFVQTGDVLVMLN